MMRMYELRFTLSGMPHSRIRACGLERPGPGGLQLLGTRSVPARVCSCLRLDRRPYTTTIADWRPAYSHRLYRTMTQGS